MAKDEILIKKNIVKEKSHFLHGNPTEIRSKITIFCAQSRSLRVHCYSKPEKHANLNVQDILMIGLLYYYFGFFHSLLQYTITCNAITNLKESNF